MDRRRFLEFLGTSSAMAGTYLATLKSGVAYASEMLRTLPPRETVMPRGTSLRSVPLTELLSRRFLSLGTLKSYRLNASIDDIASDHYLKHLKEGRNGLVISAYEGSTRHGIRSRWAGELLSAVLTQLRQLSPNDYKNVSSRFNHDEDLDAGTVLPFQLTIPTATRRQFPVDDLMVAIFDRVNSRNEDFSWVETVFELAAKQNTSSLIVPCLGRNWRDRNTIAFQDFFASLIARMPTGRPHADVYFSLYSQWPTFEIEDAVKSLNAVLKKASA